MCVGDPVTRLQRMGVVATTVIAFGAAACARPEEARSRTAQPAHSASASPAQQVALDSRTRGWELGNRYQYRLTLTTTVGFAAGANSYDFDLSGELQVVPVVVEQKLTTLYLELTDAKFVSRVAERQPELWPALHCSLPGSKRQASWSRMKVPPSAHCFSALSCRSCRAAMSR